jgi:plastocyanin
MRHTKYLLALLVAPFVAMACEDDVTPPDENPEIVASGTTFTPSNLLLSPADSTAGSESSEPAARVTWRFQDGPHNVVFEDGTPGSGSMSTGTFAREIPVGAASTFRYRCTIHSADFTSGMVGTVTVSLDN